jgi:trehalose/maltose hydrolase-like predicted phosphorylase
VIQHPAFLADPWSPREIELDLERLAQAKSVFALANGHIGLRGNLEAGQTATYSLRHGAPLEIVHHGEQSTLVGEGALDPADSPGSRTQDSETSARA